MTTTANLPLSGVNEASASILEFFDENAAYDSKEIFEDPDPTLGPDSVDLHRRHDDRGGAVKSYFPTDESSPLIYSKDRSDYHVTVERLVWVDGHLKTTGDGAERKHEDMMTLVVLKLIFDDRDSSKIEFAEAELRFQSNKPRDPDPEVKCWGPFRRHETWNKSTAQRNVNSKLDMRITGGGAGQEVSAGSTRENGMSWEQIDFDKGTSAQVHNRRGQPHGVRWKLQQNKLHKNGITREVRVAVLLSRKSSEPYRVTFRLAVHTGTLDAWKEKSQILLGMPGGKEVKWLAEPKPDSKDRCYAEGRDIVKLIDTDNFEKLRDTSDSTNLNAKWLNIWDRNELHVPRDGQEPPAIAGADSGHVEEPAVTDKLRHNRNAGASTTDARVGPFHLHVPASSADVMVEGSAVAPAASHRPVSGRTEPIIGVNSEPSLFQAQNVDYQVYSRLVSLEARAAQAEARLADQDRLILKLQQGLAKMEQLVPASIHPA